MSYDSSLNALSGVGFGGPSLQDQRLMRGGYVSAKERVDNYLTHAVRCESEGNDTMAAMYLRFALEVGE